MRRLLFAIATGLAFMLADPASARPIVYSLFALVRGTIDDQVFYTEVTFTGTGDTDSSVSDSGVSFLELSSLTMVKGADTYRVSTPSYFAINPGTNGVGLGVGGLVFGDPWSENAFTGYGPALYDQDTAVPIGQSFLQLFFADAAFTTDRGAVTIIDGEDLILSASVGTSPTPELASWAMMVMGFGAIGSIARFSRVRAEA